MSSSITKYITDNVYDYNYDADFILFDTEKATLPVYTAFAAATEAAININKNRKAVYGGMLDINTFLSNLSRSISGKIRSSISEDNDNQITGAAFTWADIGGSKDQQQKAKYSTTATAQDIIGAQLCYDHFKDHILNYLTTGDENNPITKITNPVTGETEETDKYSYENSDVNNPENRFYYYTDEILTTAETTTSTVNLVGEDIAGAGFKYITTDTGDYIIKPLNYLVEDYISPDTGNQLGLLIAWGRTQISDTSDQVTVIQEEVTKEEAMEELKKQYPSQHELKYYQKDAADDTQDVLNGIAEISGVDKNMKNLYDTLTRGIRQAANRGLTGKAFTFSELAPGVQSQTTMKAMFHEYDYNDSEGSNQNYILDELRNKGYEVKTFCSQTPPYEEYGLLIAWGANDAETADDAESGIITAEQAMAILEAQYPEHAIQTEEKEYVVAPRAENLLETTFAGTEALSDTMNTLIGQTIENTVAQLKQNVIEKDLSYVIIDTTNSTNSALKAFILGKNKYTLKKQDLELYSNEEYTDQTAVYEENSRVDLPQIMNDLGYVAYYNGEPMYIDSKITDNPQIIAFGYFDTEQYLNARLQSAIEDIVSDAETYGKTEEELTQIVALILKAISETENFPEEKPDYTLYSLDPTDPATAALIQIAEDSSSKTREDWAAQFYAETIQPLVDQLEQHYLESIGDTAIAEYTLSDGTQVTNIYLDAYGIDGSYTEQISNVGGEDRLKYWEDFFKYANKLLKKEFNKRKKRIKKKKQTQKQSILTLTIPFKKVRSGGDDIHGVAEAFAVRNNFPGVVQLDTSDDKRWQYDGSDGASIIQALNDLGWSLIWRQGQSGYSQLKASRGRPVYDPSSDETEEEFKNSYDYQFAATKIPNEAVTQINSFTTATTTIYTGLHDLWNYYDTKIGNSEAGWNAWSACATNITPKALEVLAKPLNQIIGTNTIIEHPDGTTAACEHAGLYDIVQYTSSQVAGSGFARYVAVPKPMYSFYWSKKSKANDLKPPAYGANYEDDITLTPQEKIKKLGKTYYLNKDTGTATFGVIDPNEAVWDACSAVSYGSITATGTGKKREATAIAGTSVLLGNRGLNEAALNFTTPTTTMLQRNYVTVPYSDIADAEGIVVAFSDYTSLPYTSEENVRIAMETLYDYAEPTDMADDASLWYDAETNPQGALKPNTYYWRPTFFKKKLSKSAFNKKMYVADSYNPLYGEYNALQMQINKLEGIKVAKDITYK